ncbi:MAG: transketolase [Bacillota bacterium]
MNNNVLRKRIIEMVFKGRDGHIPSALSIIDILSVLYSGYLKFDPQIPDWPERDYFILSKGHGCVALYVLLEHYGFITQHDVELFCRPGGILGAHPDCTKIPGIEASTGSLGHGFPLAVGVALGLRIRNMDNKVYVLVGDGECNEGTIWEAALVAANLKLGNLCCIIDNNGSALQVLPVSPLRSKWEAFGWKASEIDGHDENQIRGALDSQNFSQWGIPKAIVANTVKGKGVPMMEGHGLWHHRIPNKDEFKTIMEVLS